MSWLNLVSLFGMFALGALAWLIGGCNRSVCRRTVVGSVTLILALGVVVFWLPFMRTFFVWINGAVLAVLARGNAGAEFLFGPLAVGPGQTTAGGAPSIGFVLATQALPAVIFFAALMALLYHLRLIQPVVRLFAQLFHRTLRLSGAESLAGSANIFFGVEATTTIRPYVERMTRSELLTVLTCGMATVASTTLAIYVIFLKNVFPQIAGHLISASVISIPAAALTAIDDARPHGNVIAALSAGAWDGLRLAAGIATLLIAVLGVVGILDLILAKLTSPLAASLGGPLDLNRILGWLFTPLAWLLGIENADVVQAGRLLGGRMVMTEVVAYQQLGVLAAEGAVSARTTLVLSYALCGFTHVASVGIFVGGIGALAPSRRDELAGLGLRALAGASLATLITGAAAGLFYHGQSGLL